MADDGITSGSSLPMAHAALCIDASGLCIGSKGEKGAIDSSKSGNFATLISLASHLDKEGTANPIVSIETVSSAYLVKEYDGNTVVMKVPTVSDETGASRNLSGEDEQKSTDKV